MRRNSRSGQPVIAEGSTEKTILRYLVENGDQGFSTATLPQPVIEPTHTIAPANVTSVRYRSADSRKLITTDFALVEAYRNVFGVLPEFIEAGPRKMLAFRTEGGPGLRVLIVNTGGIAPGLNPVTVAIVRSHIKRYFYLGRNEVHFSRGGFEPMVMNALFGTQFLNQPLWPDDVASWIGQPGSNIGIDRFNFEPRELATYVEKRWAPLERDWAVAFPTTERFDHEILDDFRELIGKGSTVEEQLSEMRRDDAARFKKISMYAIAHCVALSLRHSSVDVVYIVGGDGSLMAAHAIANASRDLASLERNANSAARPATLVVGIPKTMDNDVLWTAPSFGFNSAVEETAKFIEKMVAEASANGRVVLLEFFGANSGFVAASAALASGHVDLAMIPEEFEDCQNNEQAQGLLDRYSKHILRKLVEQAGRSSFGRRGAIVVIAEGVWKLFKKRGWNAFGKPIIGEQDFMDFFEEQIQFMVPAMRAVQTLQIRPKHAIRTAEPNMFDRIFCQRLGELAVDCAVAGYSDIAVCHWNNDFVMVPLAFMNLDSIAIDARYKDKRVVLSSTYWREVLSVTGQPTGTDMSNTTSGRATVDFSGIESGPVDNQAGPDDEAVRN